MVKRNIKIIIAYDGSGYYGFQKQKDNLTIQGELERVLSQILSEKISIMSAGRTDAGVHALGQVINFKTKSNMPVQVLFTALGVLLPPSIQARSIEEMEPKFNSRFWAKSRTYHYYVLNSALKIPFARRNYHQVTEKLDCAKIRECFKYFKGEHNYISFTRGDIRGKNPLRTVRKISLKKSRIFFPGLPAQTDFLVFEIIADSFLSGMVRMMMGTILRVGRGELNPEDVKAIFAQQDHLAGGPPMPPYALYLAGVDYPEFSRNSLES